MSSLPKIRKLDPKETPSFAGIMGEAIGKYIINSSASSAEEEAACELEGTKKGADSSPGSEEQILAVQDAANQADQDAANLAMATQLDMMDGIGLEQASTIKDFLAAFNRAGGDCFYTEVKLNGSFSVFYIHFGHNLAHTDAVKKLRFFSSTWCRGNLKGIMQEEDVGKRRKQLARYGLNEAEGRDFDATFEKVIGFSGLTKLCDYTQLHDGKEFMFTVMCFKTAAAVTRVHKELAHLGCAFKPEIPIGALLLAYGTYDPELVNGGSIPLNFFTRYVNERDIKGKYKLFRYDEGDAATSSLVYYNWAQTQVAKGKGSLYSSQGQCTEMFIDEAKRLRRIRDEERRAAERREQANRRR